MRGILQSNNLNRPVQEIKMKIGTTALCRKLLPAGYIRRRVIDTEED